LRVWGVGFRERLRAVSLIHQAVLMSLESDIEALGSEVATA